MRPRCAAPPSVSRYHLCSPLCDNMTAMRANGSIHRRKAPLPPSVQARHALGICSTAPEFEVAVATVQRIKAAMAPSLSLRPARRSGYSVLPNPEMVRRIDSGMISGVARPIALSS
jgi:hypothetical protein